MLRIVDGLQNLRLSTWRVNCTNGLKTHVPYDKDNESGSYLITGFRGMGKSSFVGKVVHSLKNEIQISEYLLCKRMRTKPISGLYKAIHTVLIFVLAYILAFVLPFLIYPYILGSLTDMSFLCLLLVLATGLLLILNLILAKKSKPYIHFIKINVGNEIRNERDILALLSTSISRKLNTYFKSHRMLFRPGYQWVFMIELLLFSLGINFFFDFLTGESVESALKKLYASASDSYYWRITDHLKTLHEYILTGEKPIAYILSIGLSYLGVFKIVCPIFVYLISLHWKGFKRPHIIINDLNKLTL